MEATVEVVTEQVRLQADLAVPREAEPEGIVLFAHGSGSSRRSPRNRAVAIQLRDSGLATVLIDLLTKDEQEVDRRTRVVRFDIPLLAERLTGAVDWLGTEPSTVDLPIGLFGASTGAAAALITAARRSKQVRAVVARGGRVDLAADVLTHVAAPVLLIVGERDRPIMAMNTVAADRLPRGELVVVPRAGHLFEEPGALGAVARLAVDWFGQWLPRWPAHGLWD